MKKFHKFLMQIPLKNQRLAIAKQLNEMIKRKNKIKRKYCHKRKLKNYNKR